MVDRRVERGRATRERLLAAGRELFGSQGYDATSIEAILQAAQVTKGSLYHHFATKEALFDAVLERLIAEVAAAAADAARGSADPLESLRAGCETWLRAALDPAVQRIALIDAPAVVGWTRWRQLDEEYTLGGLRVSVRGIADDGGLPAEQVDLLANMVLAAVSEAALMIARADDPTAALRTGEDAVDLLLTRLART
jgi:AcrR family transcriptional regulator